MSGVDVVEAIVREDVELALALGRVDAEASEAGVLCPLIGAPYGTAISFATADPDVERLLLLLLVPG